jgi:putative phosphoesterase
MDPKALRIFVLADTHDHLPQNLEALADDVDEIWHLGDVCMPSLLVRLENVGPPVTLVRGNCDTNPDWPLRVDLQRNNVRFRLVHVPPSRTPENIDVLLHGHTHVPRDERQEGVLFLNPGCVTRPDKGAPPSIGTLEISGEGKVRWRVTRLR